MGIKTKKRPMRGSLWGKGKRSGLQQDRSKISSEQRKVSIGEWIKHCCSQKYGCAVLAITLFAINGIPFSIFDFCKKNTYGVMTIEFVVANDTPISRVFYIGSERGHSKAFEMAQRGNKTMNKQRAHNANIF